jgi:hypothetical protein
MLVFEFILVHIISSTVYHKFSIFGFRITKIKVRSSKFVVDHTHLMNDAEMSLRFKHLEIR